MVCIASCADCKAMTQSIKHIESSLILFRKIERLFSAENLEWDILNPDRLINPWRLITRGEQALFNLEIKKKSG